MIAIQTVRDVFGGFLIAGSRDRFARVRDNFFLICVDREPSGLRGFSLGTVLSPALPFESELPCAGLARLNVRKQIVRNERTQRSRKSKNQAGFP
jgi:hypothetical protein